MSDEIKAPEPAVLEKENDPVSPLASDAAAVIPGIRGKKSGVKEPDQEWGVQQIRAFDDSPLDEDGFVGVDPNFRRGHVLVESEE